MNPLYALIPPYNIYFGGYPDENDFVCLLEKNIQMFVDLTTDQEKRRHQLFPYYKLITYYKNYPIRDRSVPRDEVGFTRFMYELYDFVMRMDEDEHIYIHCKGGHGRSGMVIACLFRLLNPEWETRECLHWTRYFHNQRRPMKKKYYELGCPDMLEQRLFLAHHLTPIVVSECYYDYYIKRNLIVFIRYARLHPIVYVTNPRIETMLNEIKKNYFLYYQ